MKRPVNPARILLSGYLLVILIGALLLSLPFSSKGISFIDSLFTASSATCVTGLIVKNTATDFTLFGKIVILVLIQIGGLGYMTLSTAFLFILRRRISLEGRLLMRESINYLSYENLRHFAFTILKVTLVVEGVGALLLFLYFSSRMPLKYALFQGIFHAVSGFCNAGLSTFPNNLGDYSKNFFVPAVVMSLYILGGLGFIVISDLYRTIIKRENKKLLLHSKLVLSTTILLILTGTAFILLMEWTHALQGYSIPQKLLIGLFHSTTPRTAGFSTINISLFSPITLIIIILLMFIGASPGGTGGGIKTTTASLLLLQARSFIAGKEDAEVFKYRISTRVGMRAFVIFLLSLLWVLTFTILILILERNNGGILRTLFEVVSAFGTVGLSLGSNTIPNLSSSCDFSIIGKLLIILTMIAGKAGTLSLGAALIRRERSLYQYPEGRISIG